jgi:hypothetical protein
MNNLIPITKQGDILVVDSRLIDMKIEKSDDRGCTTYRLILGHRNEGITLERLPSNNIRISQHYDSGFTGINKEINLTDFLEALGLTEISQIPDVKLRVLTKLAEAADKWLDWENMPDGEGADELVAAICNYRGLTAKEG